jgi:hypothetical protein
MMMAKKKVEEEGEEQQELVVSVGDTKEFTIDDFGLGREEELANLLYKDALTSDQIPMDIFPKGVSVDPAKLPSH